MFTSCAASSKHQTAIAFSGCLEQQHTDPRKRTLPPNFIQQPKQDLIQGASQDCTYPALGEDTYLMSNGTIYVNIRTYI